MLPGAKSTNHVQSIFHREPPLTSANADAIESALDRIRTYDLLLRRQTLYPLSYEGGDPSRAASSQPRTARSGMEHITSLMPHRSPQRYGQAFSLRMYAER
jgi:hypothetical protein